MEWGNALILSKNNAIMGGGERGANAKLPPPQHWRHCKTIPSILWMTIEKQSLLGVGSAAQAVWIKRPTSQTCNFKACPTPTGIPLIEKHKGQTELSLVSASCNSTRDPHVSWPGRITTVFLTYNFSISMEIPLSIPFITRVPNSHGIFMFVCL